MSGASVPTKRRRWPRVVVAGVGVVISLAAGLAGLSQTAAFRDWLRRQVLVHANAALTGRLAIGALEGNLFGRLVVTDVRLVQDGTRVLAIRRLAATYDLLALLRGGGLRLSSVSVDGIAVQLVADARGWNVERLGRSPALPGWGAGLEADLHDVRITGGALRVIRPDRVWRIRGLTLAGAARLGSGASQVAIAGLSFVEVGSGVRVREATARALIDPDTGWNVEDGRIRTAESEMAFDLRVGSAVAAHVRVARLAAAELRALLRVDEPRSDWRGELRAEGPRDAVVLAGELTADSAAGDGRSLAGRMRLAGTLDLASTRPTGRLRADLERVDLAAMAGPRLLATDLTGSVTIASTGGDPRPWQLEADLATSRIATLTLQSVKATARRDDDTIRFDVVATQGGGTAHASGDVAPAAERFTVNLEVDELDVGPLLARPALAGRVNGEARIAGVGFAPGTARLEGTFHLSPSRIGDVAVQSGDAAVRLDGGRLDLDHFTIATNVGAASLAGDAALAADVKSTRGGLRGEVRVDDLQPIGALLGRPDLRGTATAKLAGRGDPTAFDATVELAGRDVRTASWRIGTLDGKVVARDLCRAAGAADIHAAAGDLVLAGRPVEDLTLDGSWHGTLAALSADVALRARESDGATHELRANVTRAADVTRVTVAKLRMDLRGATWNAVGTPVVELRGERLTVADVLVRSAQGSARLGGMVARSGSDLELVVDGLDLDALTGMVPDEVRGRLVGRAHLDGDVRRSAPRRRRRPHVADARRCALRRAARARRGGRWRRRAARATRARRANAGRRR